MGMNREATVKQSNSRDYFGLPPSEESRSWNAPGHMCHFPRGQMSRLEFSPRTGASIEVSVAPPLLRLAGSCEALLSAKAQLSAVAGHWASQTGLCRPAQRSTLEKE